MFLSHSKRVEGKTIVHFNRGAKYWAISQSTAGRGLNMPFSWEPSFFCRTLFVQGCLTGVWDENKDLTEDKLQSRIFYVDGRVTVTLSLPHCGHFQPSWTSACRKDASMERTRRTARWVASRWVALPARGRAVDEGRPDGTRGTGWGCPC